jgi:hypothetical protein
MQLAAPHNTGKPQLASLRSLFPVLLCAGERRLLDLARANLGAARAELKLKRYKALAWGDLNGVLKWKCSRQPF